MTSEFHVSSQAMKYSFDFFSQQFKTLLAREAVLGRCWSMDTKSHRGRISSAVSIVQHGDYSNSVLYT